MKNIHYYLFIFLWSKSEIQLISQKTSTNKYDDQTVRFSEYTKKQGRAIVN